MVIMHCVEASEYFGIEMVPRKIYAHEEGRREKRASKMFRKKEKLQNWKNMAMKMKSESKQNLVESRI